MLYYGRGYQSISLHKETGFMPAGHNYALRSVPFWQREKATRSMEEMTIASFIPLPLRIERHFRLLDGQFICNFILIGAGGLALTPLNLNVLQCPA